MPAKYATRFATYDATGRPMLCQGVAQRLGCCVAIDQLGHSGWYGLSRIKGVKLLVEGGTVTAATSSQICDGASGVMVVSERALKEHNLTPMARVHHLSLLGHDPVIMLEAPIPATERALKRAGMSIDDIDLFEVNEAFASVPVAFIQKLGADHAKVNVNGGAIALGHPLGASGTKLMTTLLYALQARGKKYGLQTMCEGGGLANVTIVERL